MVLFRIFRDWSFRVSGFQGVGHWALRITLFGKVEGDTFAVQFSSTDEYPWTLSQRLHVPI